MLKNLSLRTINLLVSGLTGLAALGLGLLLVVTVQNVRSIEQSWHIYQADRSEKARLESALRAAVGYGGMIHDFKNLVLRRDITLSERIHGDIGAARAIVGQFDSLGLSEAEKVALEDISAVLNRYEKALLQAIELIRAERTLREIDEQVKVDDSAALRSLRTLRFEIRRQSGTKKIARAIKGRVAAELRANLGYGAMIHEYKNLILRHDLPRAAKIRTHISEIDKNIGLYRNLRPTIAEKIAIDDVEKTVRNYEENLKTITQMIATGASVTEIDNAGRVDDAAALRGLRTLDKEIAFQVETLSKNVGDELNFLGRVVPILTWTVLGFIILTMGASVWIFQTYIIRPISTTTTLMNLLTTDETGISIQGKDNKNEIGQMARALETFRQNIISRKAAESEIRELALTDPLTGLDNRKRFEEHLDEAINMAKRTKKAMACMMIDLDKFKPVNETYGHAAGDEVLKVVGERLKLVSRDTDFVSRLGGDEFAMIATILDHSENAEILAKRIVDQLGLPVYYEGNELKIGGSVGVSIFPKDADNADDLLKLADEALYAAKDGGRNTFRFTSRARKATKKKTGKAKDTTPSS